MNEQSLQEELTTPEYEKPTEEPSKKNDTKRKVLIFGAVLAVIALIVCLIVPFKFLHIRNEAISIAGKVSYQGMRDFTIDTYPYENAKMDPSVLALLASSTMESALEAIKYVNAELGFSSSLYDDMLHTTSYMGRQSAENSQYKVTWFFDSDKGLEVTYYKK